MKVLPFVAATLSAATDLYRVQRLALGATG